MDMEIHQNCRFSQVMKFIFYVVLSSSIGIITMSFINWEAETRKLNVNQWTVKMMIYSRIRSWKWFCIFLLMQMWCDGISEVELFTKKGFLRTWAYMILIHLMNKVLRNIFLGSLSFSTLMDFKVSLVWPMGQQTFS